MKRIAIGSWAYVTGPYADDPVPWDHMLENLEAMDFDGVEIGTFPPHPTPDDAATTEDRDGIRRQMEDHGLEFSGMAPDLWDQELLTTDDHTAYLEKFQDYVDFAVDLGIPRIRVDTIHPPTILEEMDRDTARNRVVEVWKQAADMAADAGLSVSWEFEPGFAFNKPSEIERIPEEVGRENFGVMLDTCHAYMSAVEGSRQAGAVETLDGGAVELVRRLKGKINHVHLIDSDGTLHDDETSTHAPFGDGYIDWDEMMPAINEAGIPHDWWTVDLCFWPDAWEVTRQCKDYVDELNEKFG